MILSGRAREGQMIPRGGPEIGRDDGSEESRPADVKKMSPER